MREWWQQPQRVVQTNLRLSDAADMDPRQVARDVKAFGGTAMMFNIGGIWAWYPTKLELQAINPFLKDDLVGRMIEACKAEGVHLVGRFDFSKATKKAFDAHPDWFCRTRDGRPFLYNDTYQASIMGGWYQEFGSAILEEVLRNYDLDVVFINQFAYRRSNYSHEDLGFSYDENAVRAFAEFSGGMSIPDAKDFGDPAYRKYLQFEDATFADLSHRVAERLKQLKPTVAFANGYRDFIRLESNRGKDRARPEWQYQAGERARTGEAVGRGERPHTVGICHFYDFPWRDTAESAAMQMNRMGQTLANGAQPGYYFMGPIAAQLDRKSIRAVQGAFAHYIANEDFYTGLRSASRIGLYHSSSTERYGVLAIDRAHHGEQRLAFRGAYRALVESHLAFDLVPDSLAKADDFADILKRYDVLYLPDVVCLSDREAAAIDRFVSEGGAIVASAQTGMFTEYGERRARNALNCLPIMDVREIRESVRGSYLAVSPGELAFPDTDIIMINEVYVAADPKADAETLFQLMPQQRFGPPELCYPEDGPTSDPGVIIGTYGSGHAAFIPWAPDRIYQRASLSEHRQLIAQLVGRYAEPIAKVEGSRLELAVRRHRETGEVAVILVNFSGQANDNFEDPVPQRDLRLGVRGVSGTSATALWSGETAELSEPDADGYRWINVPVLRHFDTIVFLPAG